MQLSPCRTVLWRFSKHCMHGGGARLGAVDGCGATETVGEGDGLVVLEGIRQGDFPFLMAFLFEH